MANAFPTQRTGIFVETSDAEMIGDMAEQARIDYAINYLDRSVVLDGQKFDYPGAMAYIRKQCTRQSRLQGSRRH